MLTHDIAHGLRKGTVLEPHHVEALRAAQEVHLVELDEDDLHEDEAAWRLGAAVAGPGTRLEGPAQSQVRLVAEHRGLLRVSREAVDGLNRLPAADPRMSRPRSNIAALRKEQIVEAATAVIT